MSDQLRYRFGPLERSTTLLGLTLLQVGVLLAGAVLGLFALQLTNVYLGGGLALLLVLGAALATFWPMQGRSLVEWIPVWLGWAWRRARGRHRFVSHAPMVGCTLTHGATAQLPDFLAGLSIIAAPVVGGEVGVVKDAAQRTYAAIISVRGRSFALMDQHNKRRVLEEWADVISGLGREGSPISRIQWVERTVPDTGDGMGAYMRDAVAMPHTSPVVRSYLQLLNDAGPVTQQHECFLVVQIEATRARRGIRQAGGGDQGACTVLAREVHALATRLQGADLDVVGLLTPRMVAQTIRVAYDPAARATIAMRTARLADSIGVSAQEAWPYSTHTTWTTHRTDSAVHTTLWVAEWPRIDVGPDFLAPLLLQTWANRTVSVTMEPVSPLRAQRQVEAQRTTGVADEDLRNRAGFMTTVRRHREHENVVRREQELADGHADVRFSGYVTVSGADTEELEIATAEVEQAAGQSRMVLRRMAGEQDMAFTYTLPIARGLR